MCEYAANGSHDWVAQGGKDCASTRQMVCMIWGRKAVTFVRNGTVGRIYKSAPTVFVNLMAQGGRGCASTRQMVCMIWWRVAGEVVQVRGKWFA